GGDKASAARALLADWQGAGGVAFDARHYDLAKLDVRDKLELLTAMAAVRRLCTPLVADLLAACEGSAARLFREYVSKNVLNHFRQDHGYKTGEYRKTWDGREDNVHLAQLLESLSTPDEELPDALYQALDECYSRLVREGKVQ